MARFPQYRPILLLGLKIPATFDLIHVDFLYTKFRCIITGKFSITHTVIVQKPICPINCYLNAKLFHQASSILPFHRRYWLSLFYVAALRNDLSIRPEWRITGGANALASSRFLLCQRHIESVDNLPDLHRLYENQFRNQFLE